MRAVSRPSVIGVSITPGCTELARTPLPPSGRAAVLVMPRSERAGPWSVSWVADRYARSGVSEADAKPPTGRPRGRPAGGSIGGRGRLLAAALELFPKSGFPTTTVEDLVTAAGVTAPVLYHHFGTKAGLYVAAAEHVYGVVLDRHEAVVADNPTFAEAIARLMDLAAKIRAEQPEAAAMMLAVVIDTQRDPDLAARLSPTIRGFRQFFDRVAALAPEELRPTPAAQRSLARALVTLMNGLDITALMARSLSDYRQTVAALHALLQLGTAPAGSCVTPGGRRLR
jgi:AcrR family transcriptional regulator